MRKRVLPELWQAGILLLAAVAVYFPALGAGFVWDDRSMLTENPLIPAPDGLFRIWFGGEGFDYLPLTFSLFWLEWRLWGIHPAGYHAVNILLHAGNAILAWRVLLRLRIPGAWLAALLFAVHPVNVASVAWIAERKNTLSLAFYLAAALWFLRFEASGKRREFGLSLGFFLCALLSKASVVMLPPILLLCAWWQRGRISRDDLVRTAPYFFLSLVSGLVTIWFQNHRAIAGQEIPMGDALSRVVTVGWAASFYLVKLVWPWPLSMLYPLWKPEVWSPQWVLPGFLLAGILAAAWVRRRTWGRSVLFALGVFLLSLFPVLGFFKMYYFRLSPVADHWQYTAQIGILALLAAGLVTGTRRWRCEAAGNIFAGTVVLILAASTWHRAHVLKDEATLWTDVLEKDPNSWTANTNLALDFLAKGKLDEALKLARRPVEIAPDRIAGYLNLGAVRDARKEYAEAVAAYAKAVEIQPGYHETWRELAIALRKAGRVESAAAAYEKAVQLNPDDWQTRLNAGVFFYEINLPLPAIAHSREALKLKPDSADAHNNLGSALYLTGRIDEAIAEYRQALRWNPSHADARKNLEGVLLQKKESPQP